jgi:peptide/nickel transport system substrate-binding protein
LDDRRIEFIFPRPFSPFLHTTTGGRTGSVAILPKHKLEPLDLKHSMAKAIPNLLVIGAQIRLKNRLLVKSGVASLVIYKRNPYYWRKDSDGKALPKVRSDNLASN